ncbi:MAG: tetratricopeptide repeat protein [Desulfobacterium sp.]|nr:tetratricopeptide repeat protein [Desulfobacterium sp.]
MTSISKINKLFTKAQSYCVSGDYQNARILCEKIININPKNPDALNMMGWIAHVTGNNEEAEKLINKAIRLNSLVPVFHNNLGNILFAQGKNRPAFNAFLKTVKLKPDYAEAHYNLGLTAMACNKHDRAVNSFKQAIKLKADFGEAYLGLGNVQMAQNLLQEAIVSYTKAIEITPAYLEACVNLSITLRSVGDNDRAKKVLQKALIHLPDNSEILLNLGSLYKDDAEPDKAVACFQSALKTTPDDARILYNLGTTLMDSKQYSKAFKHLNRVLEFSPKDPKTLNNLGLIFSNSGAFARAIDYYNMALENRPDYFKAYNNLGIAYKRLEQKDKATAFFRKAIALSPEFTQAYHNLAEILWEAGDLEGAAENCRKAIALKPDLTQAHAHYASVLKYQCNWDEFEKVSRRIDDLLQNELDQGKPIGEPPFLNLIRTNDPGYNRIVADAFAKRTSHSAKALDVSFTFDPPPREKQKITVGYISANFRNHPMAHLLASLFKLHNRNDFNINCYSLGPDDKSIYRQRFMEDSDIFRDLRALNHVDAARQIYDDKVDILVDLMGYTQGNRMEIMALHPAPVQVRYMGLAGTTGGDFFDYIITDKIVTPKDQSVNYAEKFIYMPHTYQINDKNKIISDKPISRQMVGLPENNFVFCSFNQSYKIDPVIFSSWLEILERTKNSVLWLMPKNRTAKQNLLAAARKHGIDEKRLVFAQHLPLDEHIARLKLADLALDTRTIGGAATTSDALWGGLPVITLLGKNFASRMSASILSAIGLEELVTHTIQEYTELAIDLANDKTKRVTLRNKLKSNIGSMPLFDTSAFTVNLEQGFKKIWDIYMAGESPRIIDVKNECTEITIGTSLDTETYGFHVKNILMG